jgi:hypothetical protein
MVARAYLESVCVEAQHADDANAAFLAQAMLRSMASKPEMVNLVARQLEATWSTILDMPAPSDALYTTLLAADRIND